ncbi:PLP-dependent aminotransferase family protein, partial [Streptomyces scabiei]|nr:PLP-dependent aminotransferase family protein [Streptomyces scabiei]
IQVVDTFFVPRPLQEAALELVGSPAWPRHLRAVSRELRNRRDTLTTELRTRLPELALPHIPSGGYHLWLRLPDGTGGTSQAFGSGGEPALVAAALRAGVAVTPGRPYFSAEPPAGHLRLSFAGVAGAGEIAEGVRRLATAVNGSTVGL